MVKSVLGRQAMQSDPAAPDHAAPGPTAAGTKRRTVLLVAGGTGLVAVGGLIGAAFVKSPEQQRAEAQPPGRTTLTSTVEKRVLASTVVTRGMVGAARQVEVTPASAQGASVALVTGVRVRAGATVEPGEVVLTVSGRPLLVLPGAVPSYRDMRPNDDGKDVAQLQAALRTLGVYHGGDTKGHFGSSTKSAVRLLYSRAGFSSPDTGGVGGKGDKTALRAADDAVAAAQQAVDSLKARIAANPGATPAPGEPSQAQQLNAANKALTRAKQDRSELISSTGPMVPLGEVVFLPAFPATVAKLTAKVGDQVTAPLITFATGALSVTAELQPDQATLLKVGMQVGIISESLGKDAEGLVTLVGDLTSPEGQGGAAFIPVIVTPSSPLTNQWNNLEVRLTITSAQTSGEVLVVPLSAVSAAADGKTTVTVVSAGGGQTRVEVRPGVSGDGFVEVVPIGGALNPGDQVVVGQ
ncbi:peptidoglycan-binding protein [Catellatospora vulcania]|uniref:peptidoglycan-binding protein n=1 Tax=Catellatospora vulcania TaxID=1460450 RepID=UPI0018AFD7BA|nr:peptidoglycan-binding protein [Catellatospora vulcania]